MKVGKGTIAGIIAAALVTGAGIGIANACNSAEDVTSNDDYKNYSVQLDSLNSSVSGYFSLGENVFMSVDERVKPSEKGISEIKFSSSELVITDYFKGENGDGNNPYVSFVLSGGVTAKNESGDYGTYESSEISFVIKNADYETVCGLSSYGAVKTDEESIDNKKLYKIALALNENENIQEKANLLNAINEAIQNGQTKEAMVGTPVEKEKNTCYKVVNITEPELDNSKSTISYDVVVSIYDENDLSKEIKNVTATLCYNLTDTLKKNPTKVYDQDIVDAVKKGIEKDCRITFSSSGNALSISYIDALIDGKLYGEFTKNLKEYTVENAIEKINQQNEEEFGR